MSEIIKGNLYVVEFCQYCQYFIFIDVSLPICQSAPVLNSNPTLPSPESDTPNVALTKRCSLKTSLKVGQLSMSIWPKSTSKSLQNIKSSMDLIQMKNGWVSVRFYSLDASVAWVMTMKRLKSFWGLCSLKWLIVFWSKIKTSVWPSFSWQTLQPFYCTWPLKKSGRKTINKNTMQLANSSRPKWVNMRSYFSR